MKHVKKGCLVQNKAAFFYNIHSQKKYQVCRMALCFVKPYSVWFRILYFYSLTKYKYEFKLR